MNAAIISLLKAHFAARMRRIAKGFSSPRRILLSVMVVVLAFVWIGQTLASMLLRESFDPFAFRQWVSLPLMMYFGWHIVRVAWQRPDEPIEWSPEEEALIVGGPFHRYEVLLYRFAVILTATLPKVVMTTLVLWPDLSWSGPIGLMLALTFLELFRLVMDLATNCLSKRQYWGFRIALVGSVVWATLFAYQYGCRFAHSVGINSSHGLLTQGHTILSAVRNSPVVVFAETPFLMAADVVTGQGGPTWLLVKISGLCVLLFGQAWLILRLDQRLLAMARQPERSLWKAGHRSDLKRLVVLSSNRLPFVPKLGSLGPLIWRQSKRAKRYAGGLLVSMGIPAMLASVPLFSVPHPEVAFVVVVCGVLFYTFVLLPEAIKFDFRLDSDHLCQLKMLPMTSAKVVLGQLATPVVLACMFQFAMILFAGLFRGVSPVLMLGAMAVTLPLTVVFVALDNLVFLLYPHRPTQEGFEAFLRTILKFTGKSLLLVLAGAFLVLWAPIAASMAARTNFAVTTGFVFYSGLCLGIAALAVVSVRCVITAYERFDVSLDSV
ncbi:MAG: hypothetical protein WAO83_11785 [Fuerstiella sp.]